MFENTLFEISSSNPPNEQGQSSGGVTTSDYVRARGWRHAGSVAMVTERGPV